MIKLKTPLAVAALSGAVVATLSFAFAQPAAEQATTSVPVASDTAGDADNARRHYFLELSQPAAAVQYAESYSRYAAETRFVGAGTEAEKTKAASERAAVEANQQAWVNDSAQGSLVKQLRAVMPDATVVFRAASALNGVAVQARPDQVEALAQLPGVVRVTELSVMHPDAVSSVDFVGTRSLWNTGGPNVHGEGIGVGVIDTGIDFVHTGNGGPGGTNYALGATTTNGGTPATTFPTSKVVWGYDFAGDAYTASGAGATPVRDPNPMDTNGHGSGCASLIAGFGVNADGTTYTGPYNSVAPDIATMRIGPGLAPQAKLYAFRVFGTSGSTLLASQAVDVATAVRLWQLSPEGTAYPPAIANLSPAPVQVPRTPVLSVMNMSLGSLNSAASPHNGDVVAVQNAANAGLSMVNSAGNSYDNYYVNGGGSVATGSLAIAASYNAQLPGFQATAPANPGGAMQPALNLAAPVSGSAVFYTGPLSLPATDARYANPPLANFQHAGNPGAGGTNAQQLTVALLNDAGEPVSDANGAPLNPPGGNPYIGKVVLIDRGDIGFHNKAIAAQRAQAAACVIINNRPGDLPGMAVNAIFPNVNIPTIGMRQDYGAQLTNTGAANTPPARPGLKIAILPQNPATADEVVGYSSRGPRRTDNRLKPDMTAPAENVVVNSATTGNDLRSFNGTSSAAPHTAGAMALLRQLTNSGGTTPAWSMEELKALIMNSASSDLFVGGINGTLRYGISRTGVGRLNLNPQGGIPTAVAHSTDADFPVSISFGQLDAPATGTTTFDKEIKVVDKSGGATPRTFDLSYDPVNAPPGISFSFPDGPSVTVPGGGSATTRVRITLDGPAMRHARDLSASPTQFFTVGPPPTSFARTFPSSEAGGHIIFTENGGAGNSMRLSVYAIARPNANLAITPTTLTLPGTSAVQAFQFTGSGINTGNTVDTVANPVTDIKSYAKTFELQYERASTQTDPQFKIAEIAQVGVTSDFTRRTTPFDTANTNNQSAVMVFAVATAADFNTPGTNAFSTAGGPDVQILIDRTGDLAEDIVLRSMAWNDPTYGDGTNGSNMYFTTTNPPNSGTFTTTGYFTNILLGRPTNTMNNNVMMLPVNAQRLGLTAAASRINYKVRTGFYFGTFVHETPWLTYDLARPGIDTSGPANGGGTEPFLNIGLPGNSFDANINTANARDNRALGLMMVSMWNPPGQRVQTVRAPAQLFQIASRLPHGAAQTQRELAFSPGVQAVESRRGLNYTNNTGDYTVIFRFSIPITQGTASINTGSGMIASQTINGSDLIVSLTGVTNAQLMQFTLTGVTDELGNSFGPTPASIGFLVGDVNADTDTNSGDLTVVRSFSGASAGITNAGSDVNRDGIINSGDATIVRNGSGTGF